MGWSNNEYAEWLTAKGVPESTICLVEVYDDEAVSSYLPKELYQISADGIRGNDIAAPLTGSWFQVIYYFKSKVTDGYVIGLSDPVKVPYKKDAVVAPSDGSELKRDYGKEEADKV